MVLANTDEMEYYELITGFDKKQYSTKLFNKNFITITHKFVIPVFVEKVSNIVIRKSGINNGHVALNNGHVTYADIVRN